MNIVVGTYEELILGYKLVKNNETYKLEQTFTDHSHLGCIKSIGISRKNILASGSSDETIRLFNLEKHTELGTLMHHAGNVTDIVFHQDNHMFSTSEDGTMCVWKNYTWECLRQFRGHKGPVYSVSVHPSGKLAITVSKDRTLRTWNLITGRHAFISNIKEVSDIVMWSPDGSHYAVSIYNKIHLYKMEDAAIHCTIESDKRINNIAYVNDSVIAYGGEGGIVYLHDFQQDKKLQSQDLKCIRIKGICCSKFEDEESPLLIITASDGNIWIYKIDLKKNSLVKVAEHNTKFRVTCLAVTPPVPTKNRLKAEEELVLESLNENTLEDDDEDGTEESNTDEDDEKDDKSDEESSDKEEHSKKQIKAKKKKIGKERTKTTDGQIKRKSSEQEPKLQKNKQKLKKKKSGKLVT